MFIDNIGIHHDGVVYVPDDSVLEDAWKVRVLKVDEHGKYKVVGEELYGHFPNDEQIMFCIVNYKGTQAKVEHIYWIEKIPFAEGDHGGNG